MTDHLVSTQWKPGVSGNPTGKPKGTRHLSTWIKDALESESVVYELPTIVADGTLPIEAMIAAMIQRAINGDVRAFEVLSRYGYGLKVEHVSVELPRPILGGLSQSSQNDGSAT